MERQQLRDSLLKLAVPMMIQFCIGDLVTLVDNIMVGSLGTEVVTAVAISGQLLFIFRMLIAGGMIGAGIYVAQFYGNKDIRGIQSAVRFKVIISCILLIFGFVVSFTSIDKLLGLYLSGDSGDIDIELALQYAKSYYFILIPSIAILVVHNTYMTTLRETGNSIKAMVSGIISVIVDVILNYLLIFGNFGFLRLGVNGAALASLIAAVVNLLVLIIWTYKDREQHPFINGLWRTLKVPKALFKEMLIKSIPLFLNEVLWAIGVGIRTQIFSMRGVSVIAGISIATVFCDLFSIVIVALGNSIGIMVGQTLGTGDLRKAKRQAIVLTQNIVIICVVLTAGVMLFADIFPKFYDVSDEVRLIASNVIKVNALIFVLLGLVHSLYCVVRSGGNTLIVFIFDSLFTFIISLPGVYLLCAYTKLSVTEIYALFFLFEYLIKIIIFAYFVKKGIWAKNLTQDNKEN